MDDFTDDKLLFADRIHVDRIVVQDLKQGPAVFLPVLPVNPGNKPIVTEGKVRSLKRITIRIQYNTDITICQGVS